MTTLKLGTQETKEALDFLFDLTDAIINSLEDGKVNLLDAPKFLKPIRSAGKGIGSINQVPKEIVDMTSDEWKELSEFVSERFQIENKDLEPKIENILRNAGHLALSIKDLYHKD